MKKYFKLQTQGSLNITNEVQKLSMYALDKEDLDLKLDIFRSCSFDSIREFLLYGEVGRRGCHKTANLLFFP